jgi:hypothetical protein
LPIYLKAGNGHSTIEESANQLGTFGSRLLLNSELWINQTKSKRPCIFADRLLFSLTGAECCRLDMATACSD